MMNSTNATESEEPFGLKMVLRFCFVAVFFTGLFGNLLVCIVMIQQRRMRTVMNCFTLNLAISDLIIIVIYVPSQFAAYENSQNWPFGNVGCRIAYSIVPVCFSASIWTLLVISWERFRGIVFPFQPRLRLRTMQRIIAVIWLVGLVTALPLMIIAGTNNVHNKILCDEHWENANSSQSYWIAMFLLQYLIPLTIMTFLYGIAAWKLQMRSRFLQPNSGSRAGFLNYSAKIARQRQSQKITKMLVALVSIYLFCMLPQHVVYFWGTYGKLQSWKYYLYVFRISNVFPMANSALNPLVYGTLQSDFRKAYKLFFLKYHCCLCWYKETNLSGSRNDDKAFDKTTMLEARMKDSRPIYQLQSTSNLSKSANARSNGINKATFVGRVSLESQRLLINSGESRSDSQISKYSVSQKSEEKSKEQPEETYEYGVKKQRKMNNWVVCAEFDEVQDDINTLSEMNIKLDDMYLLYDAKETIL